MVRRDERDIPRQPDHSTVRKLWFGSGNRTTHILTRFEIMVEGKFPQRNDHADRSKQPDFLNQIRSTRLKLFRQWFVSWRSTTDNRRNVAVRQLKTVIPTDGLRLIAERVVIEHLIQQLATSIPGKRPTRSIGTLRTRRQSNDQDLGLGITKTGNRLSPIDFIHETTDFCLRNGLPMSDKARTYPTGDDSVTKLGYRRRAGLATLPRHVYAGARRGGAYPTFRLKTPTLPYKHSASKAIMTRTTLTSGARVQPTRMRLRIASMA